ncbi:hypothetical protein [Paraburkholderia xenovorans]|uniref:hypothetical protein n=1 Tax=Paraburkholderia xenovorans TaxID=36873 RepID=UPI000674D29B|nr:hypothetical protein [Paraburkholderia xenovorans]
MAHQRKPKRQNPHSYRSIYMLDLARGSSHIASALSAVSQHAAIDEVISEFRQRHTDGDLYGFLQLLAENLEKRGKAVPAATVRDMA